MNAAAAVAGRQGRQATALISTAASNLRIYSSTASHTHTLQLQPFAPHVCVCWGACAVQPRNCVNRLNARGKEETQRRLQCTITAALWLNDEWHQRKINATSSDKRASTFAAPHIYFVFTRPVFCRKKITLFVTMSATRRSCARVVYEHDILTSFIYVKLKF